MNNLQTMRPNGQHDRALRTMEAMLRDAAVGRVDAVVEAGKVDPFLAHVVERLSVRVLFGEVANLLEDEPPQQNTDETKVHMKYGHCPALSDRC